MSNLTSIKLARVDFRLIHGQVVTTWLQQVSANSILILDDELAKDEYLAKVFLMAAPNGIKVGIRTIKKGVEAYNNNVFKNKDLIVLFKSIKSAHKAVEYGLPISKLQVGGLGNSENKIMISNELSINKEELNLLKDIEANGIEVVFQVTPKDPLIKLKDVNKRVEKGRK